MNRFLLPALALLLNVLMFPLIVAQTNADTKLMFIGTYTQKEGHVDGKAPGIVRITADANQAESMKYEGLAAEMKNPSFVTVTPDGGHLFAVSEVGGNDGPHGSVGMYKIGRKGKLELVSMERTYGMYPCHVSTDSKGRYVYVANYVGGALDVYHVTADGLAHMQTMRFEGSSDHPRQEASHLHMTYLSPDERFLYVVDLGSNKVWILKVNPMDGRVRRAEPQAYVEMNRHAGPRHMDIHPESGDVYVVNELDNTVTTFSRGQTDGALTQKQNVGTLPVDFKGSSACADIHVHPGGNFVYASNRGHNSIALFSIGTNGELYLEKCFSTGGDHPRNFAIDSDGRFLYAANQNTDNIVRYRIEDNGHLEVLGELEVPTPVCIAFVPTGK